MIKLQNEMLLAWLEPSIEKRVEVLIELCENEREDLKYKLHLVFRAIKERLSDEHFPIVDELEIIYISKMMHDIELSYRAGLKDGMGLRCGL